MAAKRKSAKEKNKKSRNWVYTDFSCEVWAKESFESAGWFRYLCYGVETCPKTSKKHHQGYVQFEREVTMSNCVRKLGIEGVHVEAQSAFSTVEQCIEYCKKDGDFHSWGVAKAKGQRSDILKLKKLIDEGKSEQAVADEDFQLYVQYGRGLQRYRFLQVKKATKAFRKVEVVLCQGTTGTGKTRFAYGQSGYLIHASQLCSGREWWDGYDQERTITIDEYANQCPISRLLGILDGFQILLPIKGGFTYANWTKVFITTNLRVLHENALRDHQVALDRRIASVLKFPLPPEIVEIDDGDGIEGLFD